MQDMLTDYYLSQLEEASRLYYSDGISPLSDDEFDRLEDEFRSYAPNHPYFSGLGTLITTEKIKHSVAMLSLDKSRNSEELGRWYERLCTANLIDKNQTRMVIQPKIDGLSAACYYKGEKLQYVATRGDGSTGQNVSYIASYIDDIPLKIDFSADIEIRGELYLPKKSPFLQRNQVRSLRNACVGLINRKEEREDLKYVRFVSYQSVRSRLSCYESEQLLKLAALGFHTVEAQCCKSLKEVENFFLLYLEKLRADWGYETDGLVLSIDDSALFERIDQVWEVDHHHHYTIALKPPSIRAETPLLSLEWQMSRQGNLVPVAVFETVELSGAKINRASAHNFKNAQLLDLRAGDMLLIARSNDVIPYIVANLDKEHLLDGHCPRCQGEIVWKDERAYCQKECQNDFQNLRDKKSESFSHYLTNDTEQFLGELLNLHWLQDKDGAWLLQAFFKREGLHCQIIFSNWKIWTELSIRSGDILVQEQGILVNKSNYPSFCPSCGSELEQQGVQLFCPLSISCPEQLVQRCIFWVKQAEMEQVSEKTVRELFKLGKMKNLADLYQLTEDDLMSLEGFAEKKVKNFLQQVKLSQKLSVLDFLSRLGVPLLQKKSWMTLAVCIVRSQLTQGFFQQLIQRQSLEILDLERKNHLKNSLKINTETSNKDNLNFSDFLKNLPLADFLPSHEPTQYKLWQKVWLSQLETFSQKYWHETKYFTVALAKTIDCFQVKEPEKTPLKVWQECCASFLETLKKKLESLEIWRYLPLEAFLEIDPLLVNEMVIVSNWSEWLAAEHNKLLLKELLSQLELTSEKFRADQVKTQRIALTGKGPYPRKKMIEIIEKRGFSYSANVNKDVDLLLCEDPKSGSSKLKQAQSLGVSLISYKDFLG